jgi:hypothetical protein
MSEAYKECEKAIHRVLVQEKKLIKQLKEIQRTKMEMILILGGNDE